MEIHNFQNNPPGSSTNSNISRSFKLAVILVNISICNRNQFWKSISLPLKLNICWKNRTMQGSEHVTENDILNAYLDDGDGPHSDAFYHIPLWREFIDSHIYQIEKCAHNSWLLFEHQFHHSLGKENCKAINMRKMIILHRTTTLFDWNYYEVHPVRVCNLPIDIPAAPPLFDCSDLSDVFREHEIL